MVSSTDRVVWDSQATLSGSRTSIVGGVIGSVDQRDVVRRLARGADDLLVALVTDQQDFVVVVGEPTGLVVHLGDQRAGRVDRAQLALRGLVVHDRSDAVRGEDDHGALGNLVGLLDEDRAPLLEGPRPRAGCARSACARRPARRTARAPSPRSGPHGRHPRSSHAERPAGHGARLGHALHRRVRGTPHPTDSTGGPADVGAPRASAPWPLETRRRAASPVRTRAPRSSASWIGRLGQVWVEGAGRADLSPARAPTRLPHPARHPPPMSVSRHVRCRRCSTRCAPAAQRRRPRRGATPSPRSTPAAERSRCAAARDPARRARRAAGTARAAEAAARRRGPVRRRPQAAAPVPAPRRSA